MQVIGQAIRVFISYSHDSDEHRKSVLSVSERLRHDGIECMIDQYVRSPGTTWPLWMTRQIQKADCVLVVCSESYKRRFELDEPRGTGKGAKWEGAVITQQLYEAEGTNSKFVPVLLNSRSSDIPLILKGYTYYDLTGLKDYEDLYRLITKQPRVVPGAVGPVVQMPPESDPPEELTACLRDGGEAFVAGRFEKARDALQNALAMADAGGYLAEKTNARVNLAAILWYWDRNPEAARELLQTSLDEIRNTSLEAHRALVLSMLGTVMGALGDGDQARNLLKQALNMDRKLGRKLSEGKNLLQLAWETGHQGDMRETMELNKQALECFLSVYHTGKPDDQLDAIHGVAQSYFQRAKVHQRDGRAEGAEADLVSSLEWQRRIAPNHELAKVLRELAALKFHQQDWDQGKQYLTEAADIYHSLDHRLEEARCLDLIGRAYYTLGLRKEAMDCWASAANTAAKAEDNEEAGEFCRKLGILLLEEGHIDDARGVLQTALDMTVSEEDRAVCLSSLARVAGEEHKADERDTLLRQAIKSAKDALPGVTRPPRRAELIRDIGCYYQELGEASNALEWFEKARRMYASIPHHRGVAETLNVIAHLKGQLGRAKEEHEDWLELRGLVDGTEHHDLIAVADTNLAMYEYRSGNLAEAKRLLESAESLCRRHSLPFLTEAELNLDTVESALARQKAPEKRVEELIEELYEQLAICPENREGYLRYWSFSRNRELVGNLRGSIGLNLWIAERELDIFVALAAKFRAYVDWTFLAIPCQPRDVVWDVIPFSDQMCYFDSTWFLVTKAEDSTRAAGTPSDAHQGRTSKLIVRDFDYFRYSPASQGGTLPRYVAGSLGEGSDDGPYVVGWSRVLPPQVHRLVFENDAWRLKECRAFFVYHSRMVDDDALLSDLCLCKDWRVLPVYTGRLPRSGKVALVASCEIRLPVFSPVYAKSARIEIRRVRQAILQLLSCDQDSAAGALAQLSADCESVSDAACTGDHLDLQVYVLKWSDELSTEIYPVIVLGE